MVKMSVPYQDWVSGEIRRIQVEVPRNQVARARAYINEKKRRLGLKR